MGRVLTNNTTFTFAEEASVGVLPGSPVWRQIEPNDVGEYGAELGKVAREPISQNRQRRKDVVVDLDSGAEFEHDFTIQLGQDVLPYFVFAATKWARGQAPIRAGASPFGLSLAASSSPHAYTHSALSGAIAAGTLLWARGFSTAANNGLKVVAAASTTTQTNISGSSLVNETPTAVSGARVEVAGVRAAISDLVLTVTSGSGTIASTVLDFTTLGLTVGQFIHIGGLTSANWFGTTNRGYARVTAIAANLLSFDKADSTLATDAGTGDTVDLLFGSFLRNVPVGHADYRELSVQFEVSYPGLGNPSGTRYEYSLGNYANTFALNLPLTEKATATINFVSTNTEVPTNTQKTNASTPVAPVATGAIGTAKGIGRLRLAQDATGLTTCFTSLTLTLNNQVSPDKCLGTLGAVFQNFGLFQVDIEAEAIFTDETVVSAIRNNTTLTLDALLINDDGAFLFDIPSMTLGDGSKSFPLNESVKINTTAEAFGDATFGTSFSASGFATVPQVA